MKNYEKYADEIRAYKGDSFCADFVKPNILISEYCDLDCTRCRMLQAMWLLEDYEEPEVDWIKVEVDTPILVRTIEGADWVKMNFAKYEGGMVYVWNNGKTSWTALDNECVTPWQYAKLAESEEKCEKPSKEETKKPETDWNKVKVDTPILVRDNEDSKWLERYFAKYEDGLVYAWLGENTSYTACGVAKWKYAKLAESEEE